MVTYGPPDIGPGEPEATIGSPVYGYCLPAPVCYGHPAIGVFMADTMDGIMVIGALRLAFMEVLTMDSVITATALQAAGGKEAILCITPLYGM